MAPGVTKIGLRQIEAGDWQARPRLLDKIEQSPGAAAYVEQAQPSLIAAHEDLVKRRQRLSPHGVGRALEQNLDLRVVAVGRFRG